MYLGDHQHQHIHKLIILIPRQPDEVALWRGASQVIRYMYICILCIYIYPFLASQARCQHGARREHRDQHPELEGDFPQQVPRPESGGRRVDRYFLVV